MGNIFLTILNLFLAENIFYISLVNFYLNKVIGLALIFLRNEKNRLMQLKERPLTQINEKL